MNPTRIARAGALAGYIVLVLVLGVRNTWLAPSPIALVVLLVPLLFPLPGILRGRRYTHAWSSFLALGYFAIGVWHAAVEAERSYGLLIVFSSVLLFSACLAYVRLSREKAAI